MRRVAVTVSDVLVIAGAVVVPAGLVWFFFGAKRATHRAQLTDHSQQVTVVVRGGYTPARIEAVAGLPLRITFDRRESAECSSRVVFPDLGITRALPANAKTDIDLLPEQVGEFGFSCAMNMIHARRPAPQPALRAIAGANVRGGFPRRPQMLSRRRTTRRRTGER
jgi:Cu+-exporting ATPase